MNRRTLIKNGILGATLLGFGGISQRATYGLQFTLEDAPNVEPSNLGSLRIDIEEFKLTPRYVDDNQDATITVILRLGDVKEKTESVTVSLVNGDVTNIQDLQGLFPIGFDNIPEINEEFIRGSVTIQIDHPSLSRSFKRPYIITGPDGRIVNIDKRLDSTGNIVNIEQEEIISCDLSVTMHQPTTFFGARLFIYDRDNNIPFTIVKRNTNTGDSRQLNYSYPENNIGGAKVPGSGIDSSTSTFQLEYDGTSLEIYYDGDLVDSQDIGSFNRIRFDADSSQHYVEMNGTITVK